MESCTVFADVAQSAETIKNDETAVVGTVSPGDAIRQGDLYIVALASLPVKVKLTNERQLAPGTTQGSRHILMADVDVFSADALEVIALVKAVCKTCTLEPGDEALVGPVFRTRRAVEVDHPEHGNKILPAGECFAVIYQRAHAEEVRRQLD